MSKRFVDQGDTSLNDELEIFDPSLKSSKCERIKGRMCDWVSLKNAVSDQ